MIQVDHVGIDFLDLEGELIQFVSAYFGKWAGSEFPEGDTPAEFLRLELIRDELTNVVHGPRAVHSASVMVLAYAMDVDRAYRLCFDAMNALVARTGLVTGQAMLHMVTSDQMPTKYNDAALARYKYQATIEITASVALRSTA